MKSNKTTMKYLSCRVGNLLIGFSSDSLVLCEQKSDSRFACEKEQMLPSLFCHEWPEQIVQRRSFVLSDWVNRSGCSFVKSNGSKSLKLLFKKDQMSEERQFAFGYKKRGKTVKNIWKIRIFRANGSFLVSDLLESCSNLLKTLNL